MWCAFGKHKYEVIQKFGPKARRVGCPCCGGEWAMNDEFKAFVEWDGCFAELYQSYGYETVVPWWKKKQMGDLYLAFGLEDD
jgi:hypothetical protein